MKLYKVELDNVDWDTYDGCIIVADSEKEVYEYISKENKECFFVEKDQHIKITEIKIEDYKETKILQMKGENAELNFKLKQAVKILKECAEYEDLTCYSSILEEIETFLKSVDKMIL